MSCYEWEEGTFKLPSADFASFRKAIQRADRARKEKVFAATQECWKSLTRKEQTDPEAYRAAVRKWCWDKQRTATHFGSRPTVDADIYQQAAWKAEVSVRRDERGNATKPKRVLVSDMDYPTNRTTDFFDESASISFDPKSRTVTWSVPENNHAVEYAHKSPLGRAFFSQLEKVRWTHGTGGVLTGNNEYNREDTHAGGGANYCTGAYGYVGIAEQPDRVEPFVNARGQRVEVDLKFGRHGYVGKPKVVGQQVPSPRATRQRVPGTTGEQGRHRDGTFAEKFHGEPDIQL